jgi:hypothetical protein
MALSVEFEADVDPPQPLRFERETERGAGRGSLAGDLSGQLGGDRRAVAGREVGGRVSGAGRRGGDVRRGRLWPDLGVRGGSIR